MSDLIVSLAEIGEAFSDDKKKTLNRANAIGNVVSLYMYDLLTNEISVNKNFSDKDSLVDILTSSNGGVLFPNYRVTSDIDIEKALKNLGLYPKRNMKQYAKDLSTEQEKILNLFLDADIEKNSEIKDKIVSLKKHLKDNKAEDLCYFSIGYNEKPISAYFENIYDNFLVRKSSNALHGYDFITNKKGIGADASLQFCSTNELPNDLRGIKYRLLPLSGETAANVQLGWNIVDKKMSVNYYSGDKNLKMAIIPTSLKKDSEALKKIVSFATRKKDESVLPDEIVNDVSIREERINSFLESVAKKEGELPVLNTIIFYETSNSARNLLLQIDDLLPSYITTTATLLQKHDLKMVKKTEGKKKDEKKKDENIYLDKLFSTQLETINFLLSRKKFKSEKMMAKYSDLIMYGKVTTPTKKKLQKKRIDWYWHFNNPDSYRGFNAIKKYQNFFNEANLLDKKIILEKEDILGIDRLKKDATVDDCREKLVECSKNRPLLEEHDLLKIAYFLGIYTALLQHRELGAFGSSRLRNWLAHNPKINEKSLLRINTKCEMSLKRLSRKSNSHGSLVFAVVERIADLLSLQKDRVGGLDDKLTLAFSLGGIDFMNVLRKENK